MPEIKVSPETHKKIHMDKLNLGLKTGEEVIERLYRIATKVEKTNVISNK